MPMMCSKGDSFCLIAERRTLSRRLWSRARMKCFGTVLVLFWHWWLPASRQPGCCLTSARSKKLASHPTIHHALQQIGRDALALG